MFRSKKYIRSRGSLVLSLIAAGTVAATIVATHQVTQRFASGAVGAFNQQQAYILAQKSLAVAGLMVNRNVVLCSNMMSIRDKVVGCYSKEPLSNDSLARELYDSLRIDASWFTVEDTTVNINYNSDAYARHVLVFNQGNANKHPIFKEAEITWALRSLSDTNLRSISGALSKGYICRDTMNFNVIEKGYCPSMEDRSLLSNRDSRLLTDENKKCRTVDTNNDDKIDKDDDVNDSRNDDSVCDYYADTDRDAGIIFISVKVPYQSTDAEDDAIKSLVMNAAIRRPMSIFKMYVKEDSSMCPVSCAIASRPDMVSSNVDFPECAGFASGIQGGGDYFSDNIHTVETTLKVKNYGPGVLYGMSLLKEDIDPRTNNLLGRSMVGFSSPPLEASHFTTPSDVEEGVLEISHHTPCYSSNFYKPSLQRVTCDCEHSIGPGALLSTNTDAKNTANGVVCAAGTSICAGKNMFANNAPGTLQDSSSSREARDSLSGCLSAPSQLDKLPPLSNSVITAFEQACEEADASSAHDCDFDRIQSDQVSGVTPPGESWCGNDYDASTETGRAPYPTGVQVPAPTVVSTVFSAANQDNIPLPIPPRLP